MSEMTPVPRISEKAIAQAEQGVYVFEVPTAAGKEEIARAVADRFKVEVTAVNTLILKGKTKRFRRMLGRQADTKKAVVRLKKGQSIKMFEGAK